MKKWRTMPFTFMKHDISLISFKIEHLSKKIAIEHDFNDESKFVCKTSCI